MSRSRGWQRLQARRERRDREDEFNGMLLLSAFVASCEAVGADASVVITPHGWAQLRVWQEANPEYAQDARTAVAAEGPTKKDVREFADWLIKGSGHDVVRGVLG